MPESAAAHALLVKVQADIADIDKVINGLAKLKTATTSATTGSAAAIGAWSGAFTQAFHDIQEVAIKTGEVLVHFLEGFMDKAAEIQTEEFPLIQMLKDNQEVAKEVLEGITSAWQRIGVISNESLARAARSLLLMNVPAENLIARLEDLGKIAVATGEEVDQVAGAYQRVRQAIEKETAPAVRGVGAFGLSTLAIFQALEEHFGRLAGTTRLAEGQIVAMFQGGKISIDDLNKSLAEAGAEGGRFSDVFEQKKATFDGAVMAMKTAWAGFQSEMGKPIIDFLTPIINRITVFGQRLVEVSKEEGWQTALKAAWTVVMEEMLLISRQVLVPGFIKLGETLAESLGLSFARFLSVHFPDISGAIVKMLIPDIPADVSGRQANQIMKDFLKAMETPDTSGVAKAQQKFREVLRGIMGSGSWVTDMADQIWFDFLAHPPPMPVMPPSTEETHRAETAKQLSAALHELELAMNGIRQEQALISAAPFMGVDEKNIATIKAVESEMENLQRQLVNLQRIKDVLPLNDPQMAQLKVNIQTAENRFKALGQQLLGLTHPFQAELQTWANSFGSVAHQVANTLQQTLGAAFQSLNQFLVTGKFNAQQLLQQIILLGLQLIEQLAIQQIVGLINAKANAALALVAGKAIALAYAPAATAATIATTGAAAAEAPAAVALALGSIMGIFGGGTAHEGGLMRRRRFHSGGLAADEVPIIAQEGEIMIQRSVAQAPGMADFLLGLNAGMFHTGGFVFGNRYHRGGGRGGGSFNPDLWHGIDLGFGGPDFFGASTIASAADSPRANVFSHLFQGGFGTSPFPGAFAPGGQTAINTFWINYPGVGFVPMAVPTGGWSNDPSIRNVAQLHLPRKSVSHAGGLISRMHSGGSVGGGAAGGGGIHIYAFTDLRQLTRHMASKDGQKIIFDTVKGRRIDLGIS